MVISWDGTELNLTNLKSLELERNKTCLHSTTTRHYIGLNSPRRFHDSVHLCRSLGGELAKSSDRSE